MKKEATLKCKRLKTKDLRWKKRQPQNARGSKQKTFNEKRGNPKTQGAKKKTPLMNKEATSNMQGNQKSKSISSPKPASLN
jgi:hypothetical protein